MPHLSDSLAEIKDRYEIIIIGTGYGGAIAASRLARAGRQVCILERGREFQPGEYPETVLEAAAQLQVDTPQSHVGSRTGLYDMRVNDDINVFMGCGLGGTSLVNANVALRAIPRVFDDPRWPAPLRADLGTRLEEGYARAEEMLKPTPYPRDGTRLGKLEAQKISAQALGEKFTTPPINVNFAVDGANHVGVEQHPCTLCGDCMTGCNHHAKNTLIMNYLPDAKNHGAEIYTQVGVRWIERREGSWLVHYQMLDSGREKFDAPELVVRAEVVIVSAGALGSTEILLRSKAKGLALSDRVGERFSGNGDVLAFGYNTEHAIDGVGYGHRPPGSVPPVGPCITTVIDAREKPDMGDGMVIEEGSIAGPLGILAPAVFAAAGATARGFNPMWPKAAVRELESLTLGPYHGAIRNMQTYLVMSHDDSSGRMELDGDRLRIRWPGVGDQPIFKLANERLKAATEALGGQYVPNPMWSDLLKHHLISVHPLGGCVMADDARQGVVNHKGQVFDGSAAGVYEGLYVSDGAIIPRSLGVNPLLTISAVAERNVALLAVDRGWTIDYALPSAPQRAPVEQQAGIQFTETMRGFMSKSHLDDYAAASAQGKAEGGSFAFTLTIISDDVNAMLSDPLHGARIVGTVDAKLLSPTPLTVTDGTFNLFSDDPGMVDARRMWYRMRLTADDGKVYRFEGYKKVHHDRGKADLWPDTSTLYVTVWAGEKAEGTPLAKGILHILPQDFSKQMTTMQVRHARTPKEGLETLAKFGAFFAGSLWDVYGGVWAGATVHDPMAPPRKQRPLKAPAPVVHAFQTSDNQQLRMVRYQGGAKGPVILAPGFGVTGRSFSVDTVETNLVEYLSGRGYDVWQFDYRASPDLAASGTQFTVDDIAKRDWPAAIETVRTVSGAASVQVIGHCVGSLSLLLSVMSGQEGVRSAVCSALTPYPVAPQLTNIKAFSHLGDMLFNSGARILDPEFDQFSAQDQLFEKFLKIYPTSEVCRSPVCRRVLFIFGESFLHDQLNSATHDIVHEMFGHANLTALSHITAMIRAGKAIDHEGADVYMPHLERLKLPIAFLHGEKNRMFLPEGSEKFFELLKATNGPSYYTRHVFPEYGHMDCFVGRDAARDVYPVILAELERHP